MVYEKYTKEADHVILAANYSANNIEHLVGSEWPHMANNSHKVIVAITQINRAVLPLRVDQSGYKGIPSLEWLSARVHSNVEVFLVGTVEDDDNTNKALQSLPSEYKCDGRNSGFHQGHRALREKLMTINAKTISGDVSDMPPVEFPAIRQQLEATLSAYKETGETTSIKDKVEVVWNSLFDLYVSYTTHDDNLALTLANVEMEDEAASKKCEEAVTALKNLHRGVNLGDSKITTEAFVNCRDELRKYGQNLCTAAITQLITVEESELSRKLETGFSMEEKDQVGDYLRSQMKTYITNRMKVVGSEVGFFISNLVYLGHALTSSEPMAANRISGSLQALIKKWKSLITVEVTRGIWAEVICPFRFRVNYQAPEMAHRRERLTKTSSFSGRFGETTADIIEKRKHRYEEALKRLCFLLEAYADAKSMVCVFSSPPHA
jgi:hypothetical protein